MKIPLELSFRHMKSTPALKARIKKEAAQLERYFPDIISCHVVLEEPHARQHQGNLFRVRVNVRVPGHEIAVSRDHHDRKQDADAYVAIREAFDAARRQLQDRARLMRHDVKTHQTGPTGRVLKLFPMLEYGTILDGDGREIYFHRNAVVGHQFNELKEGDAVRFVEAAGEKGPQASTVQVISPMRVAPPIVGGRVHPTEEHTAHG